MREPYKPKTRKYSQRRYVAPPSRQARPAGNDIKSQARPPADKTNQPALTSDKPVESTTKPKDKPNLNLLKIKLTQLASNIKPVAGKLASWLQVVLIRFKSWPKPLSIGLVVGVVLLGIWLASAPSTELENNNLDSQDQLAAEQSVPEGTDYDPETQRTTYQDEIEDVIFTVSNQPIPEDIKNNPTGAKELALSLLNRISIDQIETAKGIAYVALIEGGIQRTILIYEDYLLFIESDQIVSNEGWIEYINTLEVERIQD